MAFAILVFAALVAAIGPSAVRAEEPEPARTVDRATFERWIKDLSNWGRWGKDDQKGTLNLITPERRLAAARLVREGVPVSLAHDTLAQQNEWNPNPFAHEMVLAGEGTAPWAVDSIAVTFHGYAHSHLDAVCHLFHDGKMYNGYSRDEVTADGCNRLAITNASDGIFTRGVLMDIPRLLGEKWLEPGRAIYPADLDAWEKKAGYVSAPATSFWCAPVAGRAGTPRDRGRSRRRRRGSTPRVSPGSRNATSPRSVRMWPVTCSRPASKVRPTPCTCSCSTRSACRSSTTSTSRR